MDEIIPEYVKMPLSGKKCLGSLIHLSEKEFAYVKLEWNPLQDNASGKTCLATKGVTTILPPSHTRISKSSLFIFLKAEIKEESVG